MKLKTISSSSTGNAYILVNGTEALLLEAGVNFRRVKETMNFNVSMIVGCLVTHEHMDHAKAIKEVMGAGIDLYASKGTLEARRAVGHRAKIVEAGKVYTMGKFKVLPFNVKHDAVEPMGFLIKHPDCGTILFATDTYYIPFKFRDLTNIICEVNYSQVVLDDNVESGRLHPAVRNRVMNSHMSLDTFKEFLLANDLSKVNNIVLIHLSDGNSDAGLFKKEIESITGKTVHIADRGMEIEFDKTPF